MAEPRKSTRVRTMLGGTIVFNNKNSTVECRIRNMSEEGAKILLDDHISIPQRFEFIVPQKGKTYLAKVIWRQDNEAGLEFPEYLTGRPGVLMAGMAPSRMEELEAENAMLRRRVKDLQSRIDRDSEIGG